MTDRAAELVLSVLALVAVVVLALADVVGPELVAFVVGAVLPSPARKAGQATAAAVRARRPLTAGD